MLVFQGRSSRVFPAAHHHEPNYRKKKNMLDWLIGLNAGALNIKFER